MARLLRRLSFMLLLSALLLALLSPLSGALAYQSSNTQSLTNLFKPSYDPDTDTAYISITVRKTVENIGEESIGPEGFSFILQNVQTGDLLTAVSDKQGNAFFPFSFTSADIGSVFHYQLYELKDEQPGIIYSDQVYNVVLSVEERDGRVTPNILLNDFPTAIAPFRNVYNSEDVPELPDTGDPAHPLLYAGMMVAGSIGCILCRPSRKEK